MRTALGEAQRIAQHLDDQIGNFDSLIAGLSWAVSTDPAQSVSNDSLLRRVKAELPDYIGNILVTSLDGKNIGTSSLNANIGKEINLTNIDKEMDLNKINNKINDLSHNYMNIKHKHD